MEKIERKIYGLLILLGGVFLIILVGDRLVDLLSKTVLYFMLIFFVILILYGVFLVLIGILMMFVSIRVKKSAALIIFLVGILIIILSISVIIIDSFTNVNIFEILSGIGLIFLGLRLFFHKIKVKDDRKEKEKEILGIDLLIIGLIVSLSYGLVVIMIIVSYEPEYALYQSAFTLPPFLVGIILLIYGIYSIIFGIYSIKITLMPQERKSKVVLPILRGIFILLVIFFILFLFLFTRISLLSY